MNSTRVTALASKSRLISAAAVRVLPVPVAISRTSLPPAGGRLAAERIGAIDLVVALEDVPVDGNGERIASHDRGRDPPLEIRLREEGLDPPRVRLVLPAPETDFPAVREKHVRNTKMRRVGLCLGFGDTEDRLRALGFDDCKRPAVAVS